MKLNTFLSVIATYTCGNGNKRIAKSKYRFNLFIIPRIYCKDGFNISIQIHDGAYCSSENGYRTFGMIWKEVEWGYPSEPIDAIRYNCEDSDKGNDATMNSIGSYVSLDLMEELLNQHGGIDLELTFDKALHDINNPSKQ